jgi:hypothetical protein
MKADPARTPFVRPAGDPRLMDRLPLFDGPLGKDGEDNLVELLAWRARRDRSRDVPMGSAPFVLEDPCPGCGAERVATMVFRFGDDFPLPRMEPHFECRGGRVLHQEITDAPIPMSEWSRILGRFREESAV